MRIRTMLNRKMKFIWKEQGQWLVFASPVFPPISSAMAGKGCGGEDGGARGNVFPLEPDLLPSMHHERTSAVFKKHLNNKI